MSTELWDLHNRVVRELEDIERAVQLASDAWEGAHRFPDQRSHFLNSLALNLHSFYNGLERIFESIARRFDPAFPSGERWHRDLLEYAPYPDIVRLLGYRALVSGRTERT